MATESPISAMIVDENDLQRGGLRAYLEAEADIVVVGDFQELSDAVGAAGELKPKVVLLSISPNPPKRDVRVVDTRDDGQGKANGPSQIPIDGDEGGVRAATLGTMLASVRPWRG